MKIDEKHTAQLGLTFWC